MTGECEAGAGDAGGLSNPLTTAPVVGSLMTIPMLLR